jgi:hypothetical protein
LLFTNRSILFGPETSRPKFSPQVPAVAPFPFPQPRSRSLPFPAAPQARISPVRRHISRRASPVRHRLSRPRLSHSRARRRRTPRAAAAALPAAGRVGAPSWRSTGHHPVAPASSSVHRRGAPTSSSLVQRASTSTLRDSTRAVRALRPRASALGPAAIQIQGGLLFPLPFRTGPSEHHLSLFPTCHCLRALLLFAVLLD